MSFQTLVREADLVAVVEGESEHSFFHDEPQTRIFTQVKMRVHEVVKGALLEGAQRIDVLTLGGIVEGMGQVCPGVPRLQLHRPYVLFLRRAPSRTGEYEILGMGQGAWQVESEGMPISPHAPLVPPDRQHAVARGGRDDASGDVAPRTLGELRTMIEEGGHGGH